MIPLTRQSGSCNSRQFGETDPAQVLCWLGPCRRVSSPEVTPVRLWCSRACSVLSLFLAIALQRFFNTATPKHVGKPTRLSQWGSGDQEFSFGYEDSMFPTIEFRDGSYCMFGSGVLRIYGFYHFDVCAKDERVQNFTRRPLVCVKGVLVVKLVSSCR